MSCGVISDAFLVTPGLRCAPCLRAKALRPAAVKPPCGSFSRGFFEALRGRFRAVVFAPAFLFGDFRERFFAVFVFFDAMRMLSTRLGEWRPARRARARAADFSLGVRCVEALPVR